MPGIHLSEVERKLNRAWTTDRFKSALTSVSISGAAGLRGLMDVALDFEYPVTVISGRNGAGKSTLLALAMLAFSDPSRKHTTPQPRKQKGKGNKGPRRVYQDFVFSDFFFKGPTDPDVSGVDIRWEYADGNSLTVHKQTNKWMRYERRPKKPVTYLGISRCVPAIEQLTLRSKFVNSRPHEPTANLDDVHVQRLSAVLGTQFVQADVYGDDRYGLRAVRSSVRYSSFNMGAGEDAVVQILHALQAAEPGSIVGIEEIELGIHSSALRRLAEQIIEESLEKGLQIVITSHSEHFIDALPRQARVLIERAGKSAYMIPRPTARMAATALSNITHSEYCVFVEDAVAQQFVSSLLNIDLRRRVEVTAIGSKNAFAGVARFLQTSEPSRNFLFLFDGDVPDPEFKRLFTSIGGEPPELARKPAGGGIEFYPADEAGRIHAGRLPGPCSPERWLIQALNADELAASHFAELTGLTRGVDEARALLDEVLTLKDVHGTFFELGNLLQLPEEACRSTVIQAILQAQPALKETFSNSILGLLERGS